MFKFYFLVTYFSSNLETEVLFETFKFALVTPT